MNKRSYLIPLLFFVCVGFSSIQAMDEMRNARHLSLYQQAVAQDNLGQLCQLRAYLVGHGLVAQEEIDGHITRLGGTVEVQPAPQPGQADVGQVAERAEASGEMEGEVGDSAICGEAAEQPACMQQTEEQLALLRAAIEAGDVAQIWQCLYLRLADMRQFFETDQFAALSEQDQAAVREHFDAITTNIARHLDDGARIYHNDPVLFVRWLEPGFVRASGLEPGIQVGERCPFYIDLNPREQRARVLLVDYFGQLIEQEREMLRQACRSWTWQDCHLAVLDQNFPLLLNATLSHRKNIHCILYLWFRYFSRTDDQVFQARALEAIEGFAHIVIENRDHYSQEERVALLFFIQIIFSEQDSRFDQIKEAVCQALLQAAVSAGTADRINCKHVKAISQAYFLICIRMMDDFNAIEEGRLNILLQLLGCVFVNPAQYSALLIQLTESLQAEKGESAELLRNILAFLQEDFLLLLNSTPPSFSQLLHEAQEALNQEQGAGLQQPHQAQGANAGVHPLPPPTALESLGMLALDNLFPIGVASAGLLFLGMRFFRGRR